MRKNAKIPLSISLALAACLGMAAGERDGRPAGQTRQAMPSAEAISQPWIFETGKPFKVKIPKNAAGADSWSLVDYDGEEMAKGTIQGKLGELALGPMKGRGYWRLLYLFKGSLIHYTGIAIIDNPEGYHSSKISLDPCMSRRWDAQMTEHMTSLQRRSFLGAARAQYYWWMAEPERGRRQLTKFNELFDIYAKSGIRLNIVVASAAKWAAEEEGALSCNLRYDYEYYKWCAANWPDNISTFEMMNEPDLFANATGARSASLAKAMALAVRQTRPDIKLATPSPATSSVENWFAEMMANELEPYVDLYAFHHHAFLKKAGTVETGAHAKTDRLPSAPILMSGEVDRMDSFIIRKEDDSLDYMRSRYATHAKYAKGLPAINTEGGMNVMVSAGPSAKRSPSLMSGYDSIARDGHGWTLDRDQAESLVAYIATSLHLGVAEHQYFCFGPFPEPFPASGKLQNLSDLSPKAGFYTLNIMAGLLGELRPLGRLPVKDAASARVLAFDANGPLAGRKAIAVFWDCYDGGASLPDNMKTTKILDVLGRDISACGNARQISWPPKYAVLWLEDAKKLELVDERVFTETKAPAPSPCEIVLDIPATRQMSARPMSAVNLVEGDNKFLLRIHNFGDSARKVALSSIAAGGYDIKLDRSEIDLSPQKDEELQIAVSAQKKCVRPENATSPSLQRIVANSNGETSVLAFNVVISPSALPAVKEHAIPDIAIPGNWRQMDKERLSSVKYDALADGKGIRIESSSSDPGKKHNAFFRCMAPSAATPDGVYDAIRFEICMEIGGGNIQVVLKDLDADVRPWASPSFRGDLIMAGEHAIVTMPFQRFSAPVDTSSIDQICFSIVKAKGPLRFSISNLMWVKIMEK